MSSVEDCQLPLFELSKEHATWEDETEAAGCEEAEFSKYIVYVDESGDHGLRTIDEHYPVFVLAFCVFHARHYSEAIVPAMQKFKFNHFGHDQVVLHENEIRKEAGAFTIFKSRRQKEQFIQQLVHIIEYSKFVLISCVIDKRKLKREVERNPYHTALGFCMESLYEFLREKGQHTRKSHIVVECRGKKEDSELELEFRRIAAGSNRLGEPLPFEIIFSDKKAMSSGLQLADLVARPIGLNTVRPKQENRAFDVLKGKFYCEGGRERTGRGYLGVGLKIYPGPESEKPR